MSILRHILLTLIVVAASIQELPHESFTVVEATIPQMQKAMEEGRVTSRDLVVQYLTRIALYEDKLHAAITVNPNDIQEAQERDRERAKGTVRGPMNGIIMSLKDY